MKLGTSRDSLIHKRKRSDSLSVKELRLHEALREHSSHLTTFAMSRTDAAKAHLLVVECFRALTQQIENLAPAEIRAELFKKLRSELPQFIPSARVDSFGAKAISELSKQHQEILDLKFRFQLTYSEIGAVVGMPASQVASFIHQAVQHLKIKMASP